MSEFISVFRTFIYRFTASRSRETCLKLLCCACVRREKKNRGCSIIISWRRLCLWFSLDTIFRRSARYIRQFETRVFPPKSLDPFVNDHWLHCFIFISNERHCIGEIIPTVNNRKLFLIVVPLPHSRRPPIINKRYSKLLNAF